MTVRELKQALADLPDERQVVLWQTHYLVLLQEVQNRPLVDDGESGFRDPFSKDSADDVSTCVLLWP